MIYVACLLAVLTVFAVQTGTRYAMNDWTHERLERLMSINFHRQVKLGRATWSLGLNGLVLATDELRIADRVGKNPFITAGYTEIGVPLIPMLAGDFEPRSITFTNPTVNLVQISKRTWNFSDLPDVQSLKHVAYLDVKGGQVHIIDRANEPPAEWSPRVVQKANFHLERPFENRTWPFSLSFEVPHPKHNTTVLLTGIGNGKVSEWREHNHQFDLKATNLDLTDFRAFAPQVPPISGLLNIEVHGEGVPQKNFNVNAVVRAPVMTIDTPGLGALTFRNARTSGKFQGNENTMEWKDVVVELGKFSMRSNGQVVNWHSKNPSYDATVRAVTNDINQLAKILPARLLPRQLLPPGMVARVRSDRRRMITVEEALRPARLSGAVDINARLKGTGKRTSVWADVTARNVPVSTLAELQPLRDQPLIGILAANPRARLNIKLNTVPSGRTEISNGEIVMGRSRVQFNGYVVERENLAHIKYVTHNLNLAEATPALRESASQARLNRLLGLPAGTRMSVSGFVDSNGVIDIRGGEPDIASTTRLKNVAISLSNGQLRATRVNGLIEYDGTTLALDDIRGNVNGGPFALEGSVVTKPGGAVNLVYTGDSVELSAVKAIARTLEIRSPLLTSPHLRGRLDNVNIVIRGTTTNPLVTMSGDPRNVAFQPPGVPGAVQIVSGRFLVKDNQVYLQDLRGTLGGGTFMLAGTASSSSSNLVLSGTNIDISHFRRALIDLGINAPVITGPQVLFGTMRTAVLTIRTGRGTPQFSLSGSPSNVYYQPRGVPRTFLLTGGQINVNNSVAVIHRLRGRLGSGTFIINGRMSLTGGVSDVAFDGRNLDLSNVKTALMALNVKSPLLAQQMLYGKVHRLQFAMRGTVNKPDISLVAYPADVRFEPYGSQRTMRVVSGVVTYKNDVFVARDLAVLNSRSRVMLSLRVENLSKKSHLASLSLRTKDLDLADLSSYLNANSTPATLRENYQRLLKQYGLSDVVGTLAGTVDYVSARDRQPMKLVVDASLKNVGLKLRGISIAGVNGRIITRGDELLAEGIAGTFDQTPLTMNMVVRNLRSPMRTWSGELMTRLNLPHLLSLLPGDRKLSEAVRMTGDIPMRVGIFGNAKRTAFVFTTSVAAEQEFAIQAPIGLLTKPENVSINIVGLMVYRSDHPAQLSFYPSHMDIGETRVAWHGEYTWPSSKEVEPEIDFTFELPRPVSARNLLALMPTPQLEPFLQNMSGRVGGQIRLTGPLKSPASRGRIDLYDVSVPAMNLAGLTGSIEAPDWFAARKPASTAYLTGPISEALLHIQHMKAGPITFRDVRGTVISEMTPDGQHIRLHNVVASVSGGTATLNGSVTLNRDRPFTLDAVLANVDVNSLVTEVVGPNVRDEVKGSLSAVATLAGTGKSREEFLTALRGTGRFTIRDGSIKRFGELHWRLQQLNLLQEGILGLNVNNLLAALAQVDTGEFEHVTASFELEDAIVGLNQFSFVGDELRLRAQGQLNLLNKNAELRVAGNIPRVAKGILKGPLGKLFQHLSINNMLNLATFGLLEKFPEIPILGRLAGSNNKPRAFEFLAAGNIEQPDTFTKSIMKSFRWLPNERLATPYPVFGVGGTSETVPQ